MKKFKILIAIAIILIITIQFNNIYGLEINELEIGNLNGISLHSSIYSFVLTEYDDNNYMIYSYSNEYLNIEYVEDNGYRISSSFRRDLLNKSTKQVNNATNEPIVYYESLQDLYDAVILSSQYLKFNGKTYVNKNFDIVYRIKHNDRIFISNDSNTVMNEEVTLRLNENSEGDILITDENGRFVEQLRISLANGKDIKITIPYGESRYLYFTFDMLYQGNYIDYNIIQKSYFPIITQTPRYNIQGEIIYEINGSDNITETPYIMPVQADALVLVKEEHPNIIGNYSTKSYIIEKGEKFFFPKVKKSVFQFQHPAGSSVMVESNFQITTSNETIPILPKEIIDALKDEVYGSIIPQQPSTQDTILVATPGQSVKINRLGLSSNLFSKMLDVFVETATGTTGKVEWYGKEVNWKPTGDEPLKKLRQRNISNTMDNKSKRLSIGQYEYIIVTATNGSIKLNIPSQYKLNEDFNIEIMKNWTPPQELEDDFVINNPTIPDLGSTDDIYSRDYNSNMYDWIQGNTPSSGDLTIPNISNIGQQITSFTDMFLSPIKNLFTAMPELYSLIIFAFGVSIVMFVLGR